MNHAPSSDAGIEEVQPISVEEHKVQFPNALSQFVFTRTYPRWREEDQRRETFEESVERYVTFIKEERPKVPAEVLTEIKNALLSMEVAPSMRAFWSAGPAAKRDNTMFYNCSFIPLDCLPSFGELLYVLMMGTGVGYSVESKFVNNLPTVAKPIDVPPEYMVIPDTTKGWMDALTKGMTAWYQGRDITFDFSKIREAGARLKTKGGRASGPQPLKNLLNFTKKVIQGAIGRKLFTVECNDIACMVGEIVVASGVRRSALISFSDPTDNKMRDAKKFPICQECGFGYATHLSQVTNEIGVVVTDHEKAHLMEEHGMTEAEYLEKHPDAYLGFGMHRFLANNSAFWSEKPSRDIFDTEWKALRDSGSGERGFYFLPPAKVAERGTADMRSNPCGEILLRYAMATNPWTGEGGGGQFCNLSAAIMRPWDTVDTMAKKVYIATWIGAIQSTFIDFPHLRPAWRKHCEEDRLLGVDITGHCDNPALSTDEFAMKALNTIANSTASIASGILGINEPKSVTCGKPSGNSSQLFDCASGFHTRYAPYYIRRVRVSATDPLFQLIRDSGVPVHKDNKYQSWNDADCPTWVAEFPVKSPEGAMTRDDEGAIGQLNRYLQVMRTWISTRGHNQSATVYVRDHEWDEVGDWLFENWNHVTGLSFLPYDGGKYSLAPYEAITKEQYEALVKDFPDVDYNLLQFYEKEDMGQGSQELACVGGSCEVDWSIGDEPPPLDDIDALESK